MTLFSNNSDYNTAVEETKENAHLLQLIIEEAIWCARGEKKTYAVENYIETVLKQRWGY